MAGRSVDVLASELELIRTLTPAADVDQLVADGLAGLAAGSTPDRVPAPTGDGAELDAYADLVALRGAELAELREQRAKARRTEVGIAPLRAQLGADEPVVVDRLEELEAEQDQLLDQVAELESRAAERGIDVDAALGPLGLPPGNRPPPPGELERRNAATLAHIATPAHRRPWWRRMLAKTGR
jgi:hypothetical protein